MTKRRDLKPGQVFVNPFNEAWQLGMVELDDILVVIDEQSEVGFYRGGRYRVGEVSCPVRGGRVLKAHAPYLGKHGIVAPRELLPLYGIVGAVAYQLQPQRLVLTHVSWKRS